MHTSSESSIDTSLIRDIYCGREVLLETCVAVKFVDDDDDDDHCILMIVVMMDGAGDADNTCL